jgi:hypothetical protein
VASSGQARWTVWRVEWMREINVHMSSPVFCLCLCTDHYIAILSATQSSRSWRQAGTPPRRIAEIALHRDPRQRLHPVLWPLDCRHRGVRCGTSSSRLACLSASAPARSDGIMSVCPTLPTSSSSSRSIRGRTGSQSRLTGRRVARWTLCLLSYVPILTPYPKPGGLYRSSC